MPADYTSSINLRDGRQVLIAGFCRNGERRVSLRIGNEVVFMDELEVITLIREITIALSRSCKDKSHRDREAWQKHQKQPQQRAQEQAQQKQTHVKQQSQEKRAEQGMDAGKIMKI